ncbi:hypothetical protein DFH11DRAFT_1730083 [Phellopilus nigrolimitatus]|nr:hypothetical protein DFH11DRAFT_1730083 [Phellopilus nigrolimitatus]
MALPPSAPLLPNPEYPAHDHDPNAYDLDDLASGSDDDEDLALDLEASLSSFDSEPRTPPPPYLEKAPRHARRPSSARLAALARRPRHLVLATVLLLFAFCAVFAVVYVSSGTETQAGRVPEQGVSHAAPGSDLDLGAAEQVSEPDHPEWVLGAPTESFRDNLRNDTQYITSWIAAGWTNDFMTYINLLYLALLSGRTAVLPPFAPSHVGSAAGFVPFGDVFDVPRLSRSLHNHPIIEWRDLKRERSTQRDALGCWSIWATAAPGGESAPRANLLEAHLALDVAYTPVPRDTVMLPQFDNDPHTRFAPLAALTFPDGRARAHLPAHAPFPATGGAGHAALPDEQLACFDFPYYVGSANTFEFNYDYSPAWRSVGTHAHWTPFIASLARDLVRRTFGLAPGAALPPFVSMHVRHGDFGRYCADDDGAADADADAEGCFAPLSAFAVRVAEVKAELRERHGVEVEHVLVTSDERDPAWWQGVRDLGWEWVDHGALGTEETFGRWYPVLVDAVVQSLGAGFVGTDRSTMSLIAQRRVQDWNAGPTRTVRWGRTGADDHRRRAWAREGGDYEFAI